MATPVSRDTVQAFLQAFASRDPGRIGPFLHDDVRWNIVGPVELISHFSYREAVHVMKHQGYPLLGRKPAQRGQHQFTSVSFLPGGLRGSGRPGDLAHMTRR